MTPAAGRRYFNRTDTSDNSFYKLASLALEAGQPLHLRLKTN